MQIDVDTPTQTKPARIALVGDYNPDSTPHRAIPLALSLACEQLHDTHEIEWVHSARLSEPASTVLGAFHGIWCVPGSPYANTRGVLDAIGFARSAHVPFLGTCGGFQHALLEYAEAVWGLPVDDLDPIIAPLACMLDEQPRAIQLEAGSRLEAIYQRALATEVFHCSYGLNPKHSWRLSQGPLRVAARFEQGDVRAIELDGHPFYFATLFQPERSALTGAVHPLIRAFVSAAHARVE